MEDHLNVIQDGSVYEAQGEAALPSLTDDTISGPENTIQSLSAPMNDMAFVQHVFGRCDPDSAGRVPAASLKDFLWGLDGHAVSNETSDIEVLFLSRLMELLDPEGANPLIDIDTFHAAVLECTRLLPRELPVVEDSPVNAGGPSAPICDTSCAERSSPALSQSHQSRFSPHNVGELYNQWRIFHARNEELIEECVALEEKLAQLEAEKDALLKKLSEVSSKEAINLSMKEHIDHLEEQNATLRAEVTRLQENHRSLLQRQGEALDDMRAAFDQLTAEKNILERETAAEIQSAVRNLTVRASQIILGFDVLVQRMTETVGHVLTKLELADEKLFDLRRLLNRRQQERAELKDISLSADLARASSAFLPAEFLFTPDDSLRSGGREYEYGDEGSVRRYVSTAFSDNGRNTEPEVNDSAPTEGVAGNNWIDKGLALPWLFLRLLLIITGTLMATLLALPLIYFALFALCRFSQLLLILSAAVALHVNLIFPNVGCRLEDVFELYVDPLLGVRYHNHPPPV